MSLRIGVDLDGTLADLSSLFHEYEAKMFGRSSIEDQADLDEPASPRENKAKLKAARTRSKQQEAIWHALKSTPDFWTLLKPIEPDAVRQLHAAATEHNWEVFFVTQRPKTAGKSVQKQSQDWLVAQGFSTPTVLTLTGSRGKAAHILDLDFLIDDLPKNCVDVISDSSCRPILVLRTPNQTVEDAARGMKIGVVRSVVDAIQLLSQPAPAPRETAVSRVLKALGLVR